MTARNDDGRGGAGGVYDGTDPLMAVLAGDPLPEDARRDADFMAAHSAAEADVALLREQLGLIGDRLALDAEPSPRPGAGTGSAVTSLSARRGRPRPLTMALRGLAAAAAATAVLGMGWLVAQSGTGVMDDNGGGSAADSAAEPQYGDESGKLGHAGYLACARLVVEGTVAGVEPVAGTGQDRVTLDVDRSYKPAEGQDQVVFALAEDTGPRPRPGDHVLVGITRGQAEPDLWTTGEKEIARDRAWITAALPQARTIPCPRDR
ncbi:hypothetical protein [Streptomyces djakartensis]|uniref:Anti-sigma factor n=1 Tax=Streptomyces djakartensis TaxID=68193 RepID=A0ABQ2ZKP0_9ACTN|nr:hypothetical protein [Streptomyces djakartensis]GGY18540.1 hypothetical protein GCM10010384_26190 [Streptomyces djakartensis]